LGHLNVHEDDLEQFVDRAPSRVLWVSELDGAEIAEYLDSGKWCRCTPRRTGTTSGQSRRLATRRAAERAVPPR
jgi:hypothetical protein